MTTLSQTALELLIQVTLWSTIGIVLLMALNRYFPLRLAHVALCFLAGVVLLTALVWVPWPGWVSSTVSDGSTPVGSNKNMPEEDGVQAKSGFNFTLALKSWQQLMPTLPGSSPALRQPGLAVSWAWWGLLIIVAGMVIGAIRLLLAFRYARLHLALSTELTEPSITEARDQLAKQLGIGVQVRLLASPTLQVPATVGYWQPAILLPVNWNTWSSEECRTVLAHELAHIRRTDYLMMVMTQIITIFYWFHPLVRGLSRWMRCGQELAADALAVRVLGDQASYLRSLCRLALDQDGARLLAPARLFLSPEVSLLRRIAMLREGSRKLSSSGHGMRWVLMLLLVVTGTVVASLRSDAVADDAVNGAKESKPSTGWQRYVDVNAPGFAVFHPHAGMSLASMQPHRETLNRLFKDDLDVLYAVFGMGVPLDAVECVAGSLVIQPRKNNEKGTGSLTIHGVYFQLRTKEDAEAWLKHCTVSVEKVVHPLGTYYKSKSKPMDSMDGACFLRPDERTLVFAQSENELQRWLADVGKPVTSPAWLAGMPDGNDVVSIAFNLKNDDMKKSLHQFTENEPASTLFKPVYEHEGSLICTLLKEDQVAMQIRLGCSDGDAAAKKEKQLQAMITMCKQFLPSPTVIGGDPNEVTEVQLTLDVINNLKSSRVGNMVQFTTHSTVNLGDVMKQQILEIKGKMEKK